LLRLAEKTVTDMFTLLPASHDLRRQFGYLWRLQKGWRARLRYAWRVLFAPSVGDWEWWPLPSSLRFLYAILRPLRLLSKYIAKNYGSGG
jgi:hypothetical protein